MSESIRFFLVGDKSYHSVINSILLSLLAIFYITTFASFFKIPIVIFQNGVTYNAFFSNTYVINQYIDSISIIFSSFIWVLIAFRNAKIGLVISSMYLGLVSIAICGNQILLFDLLILTSLPGIVILLIFNKLKNNSILKSDNNKLVVNYLSILGIIFGSIGILLSSSVSVFSIAPQQLLIHNYFYPLYVLFSNLAPVLIFLLSFSFFVKYLFNSLILSRRLSKFNFTLNNINSVSGLKPSKGVQVLFLLLFISISIIVSLIPTHESVNKTNQLIGVDTDEYMDWINGLRNLPNIYDYFYHIFIYDSLGDRPLTLTLMSVLVSSVPGNNIGIIQYMPILLGPLLVMAVFFLTKELTSNVIPALIAAFLTAVSFQVLIGIYSGFYANWLALILGYFSFVFLFKYLRHGKINRINLLMYTSLVILAMLSHVYTWTILTVITGIFLTISYKLISFSRRRILVASLCLLVTIIMDIARIYVTGASSSGLQETIYLMNSGLGIDEFYQRWNNLTFTSQIFVGGIFSDIVIYVLVLSWLFRSRIMEPVTIFFMTFMSIGIIPLFLGDEIIQSRVLYDIPFQIPAAMALFFMMKNVAGRTMMFSICVWILFCSLSELHSIFILSIHNNKTPIWW